MKHIASVAQLYSHARDPQSDSTILRSWSKQLPVWWELYAGHRFHVAYKFISSALCLQLPHHEKPIQRGGSWQEIKDIMSLLTVTRKKSELTTTDLDLPVNLLGFRGREQLLGFNGYLAWAEAWRAAMPTPGFWKDIRRLGGVKDNS